MHPDSYYTLLSLSSNIPKGPGHNTPIMQFLLWFLEKVKSYPQLLTEFAWEFHNDSSYRIHISMPYCVVVYLACPKHAVCDCLLIRWRPVNTYGGPHFRSVQLLPIALSYFEIIDGQTNMKLPRNNTMGSNWIDLKRSSQYAFTNLKPMKKQPPTEGLGQAIFYYSHLPGSPYWTCCHTDYTDTVVLSCV